MGGIYDLVRAATVVITAENAAGARVDVGTGFFVAPGWILSCAHVVAPKAATLRVRWFNEELKLSEMISRPPAADPGGTGFGFPDAALLQVSSAVDAPCVPITVDRPAPGSPVWAYGITKIRTGRFELSGSSLTVADQGAENGFIRIQGGQILGGMSGGPVLDVAAGAVCGVTKSYQDERSLLGGWAVPIAAALGITDEPLAQLNAEYHADSIQALRRGQIVYGKLPARVLGFFQGHPAAWQIMAEFLADRCQIVPPPALAERDRPEWVIRQLFRLDLPSLRNSVLTVRDFLGGDTALKVFDHVACCLPVAYESGYRTWAATEASQLLQLEARREQPRIVRIHTDQDPTVEVLLRRSFADYFSLLPAGGPSSAAGEAEIFADMMAELRRALGISALDRPVDWQWDEWRQMFRESNGFLRVHVDAAPDAAWLRQLARHFAGVRLLIRNRGFEFPDDIDDVVLDLLPPVDEHIEFAGIQGRRMLSTAFELRN